MAVYFNAKYLPYHFLKSTQMESSKENAIVIMRKYVFEIIRITTDLKHLDYLYQYLFVWNHLYCCAVCTVNKTKYLEFCIIRVSCYHNYFCLPKGSVSYYSFWRLTQETCNWLLYYANIYIVKHLSVRTKIAMNQVSAK